MAAMQFWGVDVKAKEPCKVAIEDGHVIHLSQATLSEVKKDNEPVTIHVKVGEKKLVLGMLSQTTPQLMFDLVFDEDFEISHNWKNGSIHLLGYESEMPEEDDMFSDSSDDEEDVPVPQTANGNVAAPVPAPAAKPKEAAKPATGNKPKPEETDDSDEDDSDDDDEDDSDAEDDSDEDMLGKTDDSDEDDNEDDSDEEDEKPAKSASGKKRPNGDAKTPEPKKAKLVTPQKTDGKKEKGVHTATPHPSKKGGKSPAGDKSAPKSGGQLSCTPCKKTFNSDGALQSHNKAKHSAAK